jgi:N-(2-amino-2-carboxyethyl)-L-glutamate synthase
VPIISVPQPFNEDDLYVDLRSIFGRSLFLKCEGFNFAGSIKLKAAAEMVEAAERDGLLTPESVLVESSSGNLGVALSMLAASKGYRFLCVTDSRCNLATRLRMEALGSQVHIITEPDAQSGFLGARLSYLRALCASDDRYVWLDQYTNPGNWEAHHRATAPAIARQFPRLDVLFVGAGTTGTLMGCTRWAGVGAEPAGAAALAGLECALERGMAARSDSVVLLVTGREVKVGGAPADLGRVAVVERLDEVERALAGDR